MSKSDIPYVEEWFFFLLSSWVSQLLPFSSPKCFISEIPLCDYFYFIEVLMNGDIFVCVFQIHGGNYSH